MLSFLKKLFPRPVESEHVASQPPGEPFPWPRGARLTALEPVTIAIPAATLAANEQIGAVIRADPDMEIGLPSTSAQTLIYLRLKAGQSVELSKSVQAVVVAEDKAPKRIRVRVPPVAGS